MRFREFIIDELSFQKGSDQDYPAGMNNGVLLFNPTEQYIKQGETHGIISHAIKHLKDFDGNYYSHVVEKIKNELTKNKRLYYFVQGQGIRSINNATTIPYSVIINTMDRINDKIIQAKPLEPEEKSIASELQSMARHFERIVEGLISGAVIINNDTPAAFIEAMLAKKRTIKYTIHMSGADIIHYYNPREHSLVIEYKGLVRTAFKINKEGWYNRKDIKFYNPELKKIMLTI